MLFGHLLVVFQEALVVVEIRPKKIGRVNIAVGQRESYGKRDGDVSYSVVAFVRWRVCMRRRTKSASNTYSWRPRMSRSAKQ